MKREGLKLIEEVEQRNKVKDRDEIKRLYNLRLELDPLDNRFFPKKRIVGDLKIQELAKKSSQNAEMFK